MSMMQIGKTISAIYFGIRAGQENIKKAQFWLYILQEV